MTGEDRIIVRIIGHLLNERDRSRARATFIKHILQPTLRSAILISKTWERVVTKYLYISSSNALEALADTLSESTGRGSRLRPYVSQFIFSGKAFGSGPFPTQYTAKDAYNQWRILRLCPNLQPILQSKPWTENKLRIHSERTLHRIFKCNGVTIDRVTHLEITLLNDAFLDGKLTFLSNIEFPVLQKLHIVFKVSSKNRKSKALDVKPRTLNWPEMPQLRCLTLENLHITSRRRRRRLIFPKNSLLVNTIELLEGNYVNDNTLFDPHSSPFCRYAKTLETLTITAPISGHCRYEGHPRFYLDFLKSLVELCIMGVCIDRAPIVTYPPRLQHLVLADRKSEEGYESHEADNA